MIKNSKRYFAALAVTAAYLGPSGGGAHAADYPSQPITFIVPYSAGGSSDTRSRQLAQKLSESLGATVVVENRPGASGNIGTSQIARAKPDGYTIGLGNFAPMAVNKSLYGDALPRSEEHTSELQSLMRISYAVFCLKKKKTYKADYKATHDHILISMIYPYNSLTTDTRQ